MTEDELEEIEARMANFDHVDANYADETMRRLIAEVRRLRDELEQPTAGSWALK